MPRYAFLIQYQGRNYAGSQIQFAEDGSQPIRTIQGELEKVICTLTGMQPSQENIRPIKTVFSGRTDAGVNSIGQVVHVDIDEDIVASNFINSTNALLPKDISISDFQRVSDEFHAQKSAKKRHYRYVFLNRKHRKAFDGELLRIEYDLNLERMQDSLNFILGEHDFSSFKSSGSSNNNNVCCIYEANIFRSDDMIIVDIVGNRFLYNMIRIIVGTLLMIERKSLDLVKMKSILESRERLKAGKTINPDGLTLIKVEY